MNDVNKIIRIYPSSPEYAHLIKHNCEMELTKKAAMQIIPVLCIAFERDMATAEIIESSDMVILKVNMSDINLRELSKSINAQVYDKCQHDN